MRQGLEELPFQKWFGQPSYKALASLKRVFFTHLEHRNLSLGFENFRGWLWDLRPSFGRGLRSKEIHEQLIALRQCKGGGSENEAALGFDDRDVRGTCYPFPVDRGLKGSSSATTLLVSDETDA